LRAEIVSVGTELLLGEITDTNAVLLAEAFVSYGILHYQRTTIGDNRERCSQVLRESLTRCDVVFTIGGLGPTSDDLTREAIADALGDELVYDAEQEAILRERLRVRGREWVSSLGKMCWRPSCARVIRNDVGTAPGLICEHGGKYIIALPGPREEFRSMLEGPIRAWLQEHSDSHLLTHTLKVVGIPESKLEEMLSEFLSLNNPTVALYAKPWEVHIRVAVSGANETSNKMALQALLDMIRAKLGNAIYSENQMDLPEVVVSMLHERRENLATAESCTGGMLGERITSVSGASNVYVGGFVTYSNEMKARSLGVARVDLDKFGAVSEPIARQMAEGARMVCGCTYGIGITGIAGPEGGSKDKPVGLVYIGLASHNGTIVRKEVFPGNRELIRYRATQTALVMLREILLEQ
jgi:nicotinamide-nucleotide amidase